MKEAPKAVKELTIISKHLGQRLSHF